MNLVAIAPRWHTRGPAGGLGVISLAGMSCALPAALSLSGRQIPFSFVRRHGRTARDSRRRWWFGDGLRLTRHASFDAFVLP